MTSRNFLLNHGADIAIRDLRWRCSPVGWAMESDRRGFAEWLVAYGKPDFIDDCGLGLTDRARDMLEQNPALANGLDGKGAPLRVAAANGPCKRGPGERGRPNSPRVGPAEWKSAHR